AMVQKALAAAETLDKEGVSAEVLDLRTISPLDKEAILKSVEKTGRAIILHEATLTGGVGGEIAAIIADEGFDYLNAPIKRVAAPDCPIPFSPVLEQAWVPNEEKVIAAVKQVV
ncbi:MAG: alpha-ketoacid dehydrogenase subunit beta, partial [Clostridiales bacterium]|nr:alpha-ketoacid dehydrogenase subunit beta [Clostridiales bacterium]